MSIFKSLAFGCACGKESVTVQNRKYYVRSRLGEGGFSVIDLVEESHSHRMFALKRITCYSRDDEKHALHEAELMSRICHRNLAPCEGYAVVPVSGHATAISEVLIVMPYYKKGSVHDELVLFHRNGRHMSEPRVIHLMTGLCQGVLALHASTPPVAHRDIKPHNVMLHFDGDTAEDIPVLMDFGSMGTARVEVNSLAEARGLQDFAAEHCSMPYRAPELFQVDSSCTVDERVDIWSLGCTLYAMCFYESPFDSVYQRGDSVALAVLSGNIRIPDSAAEQYSNSLLDLMRSLLSVDPVQRPTLPQIIEQLNQILPSNLSNNNRV